MRDAIGWRTRPCFGRIMGKGQSERGFLRVRLCILFGSRPWTHLLVVAALAAGSLLSCDDGSGRASGQTGDPGCLNCYLTDGHGCAAESWPSFDEEIRTVRCEGASAGGFWSCDCGDGLEAFLYAVDCPEALESGCGIDPHETDHCTTQRKGTCWPGDDQQAFACLCASDAAREEWRVGVGESCFSALASACAE